MEIPEITISGEKIFTAFGINFTNTFIISIFIGILLSVVFISVFRKAKVIPGRLQNFLEFILESLYKFCDSITNDQNITRKVFPVATTLFLLILSANILELVPGLGIFKILRSPSSDLNFTLALALFSIVFINISAAIKLGFFRYIKKYVNFKSPIDFALGILEGIGEFTRILSLAFRLFGNLFAGETLLIITSFLFSYLLPLPFLALEILVGFIQALIFFSLVVIFYSTAVKLEHE
ncbi:MAG: F0F1 ATP synthase subunit A [bacterium]